MKTATHVRQLGASKLKSLLILFGIGSVLIVVLAIATTTPSPDDGAETTSSNATTGGKDDATSSETSETAQTSKLPEDFRRFSNKKFGFSVAYPESWGNLLSGSKAANAVLLAETTNIRQPIGKAQLEGGFGVAVYPAADFQIAPLQSNLLVKPSVKDSKTSWIATTTDAQYRAGDAYPMRSSVNPNGLAIYNFSRLTDGKSHSRWVFKSGANYILMYIPPLAPVNGIAPSEADLKTYNDLAASISKTVSLPK